MYALFQEKQRQIHDQITQLQVIENDLTEALEYLDSCRPCSTELAPTECSACEHQGHHKGEAPPLFAGLTPRKPASEFDVPVTLLSRAEPDEGNN